MLKAYLSERLKGRELLALALREEYGLPALPGIERRALGKPFFPGCPELYFNVSHSGPWSFCAVGNEEVGADVERVRPRSAGLPRYALTEREYERFQALGASWKSFYVLWTAREAWSKYTGEGVARSRRLDIPECLSLSTFEGGGWRAAVCARTRVEELCIR
ncbi:MAG: 4'-phosphopantetheinyl transferase superfamily protein [Clostridia bacterium]|nr:4'-phosphopantetheinyl transferase superfamily protein [Clostridia bacterium]